MQKLLNQISLILVVLLMQMSIAFASATTKSMTIFANVLQPANLSILSPAGLKLSFDPLNYNAKYGTYTTGKYYVVEVANFETVQISYKETSSPKGASKKLGQVAFISLVKAVYQKDADPIESTLSKHALHNLNKIVNYSLVSGGWLKVYIGLASGASGEPSGVSPFTVADKPGTYTGVMTLTATAR